MSGLAQAGGFRLLGSPPFPPPLDSRTSPFCYVPPFMSLTPHMDHLMGWIAVEKTRGLVDFKVFVDPDAVRATVARAGHAGACEELAAETFRMVTAPTLPDPDLF